MKESLPPLVWRDVKKAKVKCAICGKPDWCSFAECSDGSILWTCMRIQNDRPAKSGYGWLHRADGTAYRMPPVRVIRPAEPRLTPRQCLDLWRACKAATMAAQRERHAKQLGVSVKALESLGAVYSFTHGGWLWPMRNEYGTMTGLRVRTEAGDKWAVTGSTAGLFLTAGKAPVRVYLVEGPTDCAAMLTVGLYAIGRHACLGQEEMTARYLRRVGATECVIVADADEPGQRGAEKLLAALPVPACVITPPAKDIRQAINNGMTAPMIEGLVRQTRFVPNNQAHLRVGERKP